MIRKGGDLVHPQEALTHHPWQNIGDGIYTFSGAGHQLFREV